MKVSFSQLKPSRKKNQFSPEPSGPGENRNSGFDLCIWATTSALCWVSSPFIHSANLKISITVSVPQEKHPLLFMSPRRILIPLLWFDHVPRSSHAGNVTHALAVPEKVRVSLRLDSGGQESGVPYSVCDLKKKRGFPLTSFHCSDERSKLTTSMGESLFWLLASMTSV